MIPKNIKREHIIKAIEEVKEVGIPKDRTSKKFFLEFECEYYPPKYVISFANKYANGKELGSSEFSGGKEANDFLRILGFSIVRTSSSKKSISKSFKKNRETGSSRVYHDERCPKCKETVRKLLEKIYGKVEQSYKFEVGVHPEDFIDTPFYNKLKEIYEVLQNHRGFREFVKSKTLPNCDFFVPNPGFIIEFDESQHFTLQRKIALEHYPGNLKLGFVKTKWIDLCSELDMKDNDPPFRDEQRAWYDTLRDFLPEKMKLEPTVRLLANDFKWCSLDAGNQSHISIFKNLLKGSIDEWEIEIKEDLDAFLSRIVIAGEWDGNVDKVKKVLEDIYKNWPRGKRVKFIVTCGAFIQFDFPKSLSSEEIGNNKDPESTGVNTLVEEAKKCLRVVLSDGLSEKLKEIADYITFGIDSRKKKISTTQNFISQPHIELAFLIDLMKGEFLWTGKSYPTTAQEKGLVRISDLKTHFFNLKDVGRTMILGCHDLNIFNNRNWERTGQWRKGIKTRFRNLAKSEKPVYVLHHPHTTVKKRTWLIPWSNLRKEIPSVKYYLGSVRYYEPEQTSWDSIEEVLEGTKSCNTIDVIVWKKSE